MKNKILTFFIAIAILLFSSTTAFAQQTKVNFNKNGEPVYQSAISDIDSVILKQIQLENIYVVNISEETDWNCMVLGLDKSCMFFNIDEDTEIPTLMFLQPDINSDFGYTFLFKENGMPDKIVFDDHIICFGNFRENKHDMAIIYPDHTIEYFYDITSDTDWDNWDNLIADKGFFDIIKKGLNAIKHVVGVGTCVTTLFFPPAGLACATYVVSELAHIVVDQVFDGIAAEYAHLYLELMGCAGFDVLSCLSALADAGILLTNMDLEKLIVHAPAIGEAITHLNTPRIDINTHPIASIAVIVGNITDYLNVSATVTHDATLSYQWYSNTTNSNTGGTIVPGATYTAFAIPTTLTIGTYYYFCEVGATGGAIPERSNVTTVSVSPPIITIDIQPVASIDVTQGSITSSLSVSASVSHSATLSYQWYSNSTNSNVGGAEIPGATSANFAILTTLTEGTYYYFVEVRATNEAVSVRSNATTVNVTVIPVISITSNPTVLTNLTIGCITGSLNVTATVPGSATLSYQWYSNTTNSNVGGTIISGATSASFTIPASLAVGTYYYYCIINATGGAEPKTTEVATVNILAPVITINTQPTSSTNVAVGKITGSLSVTASVTCSTNTTISYQWYSNTTNSNVGGTIISGAISANFTIPTTLAVGTYYYFCEVNATGGATSKRSNVATVCVTNNFYIDENGVLQVLPCNTNVANYVDALTLNNGWHRVDGTRTPNQRIKINGNDVRIILTDNCHLNTSNGGIEVTGTNKLTIYSQSFGSNMGKLTANGTNGVNGVSQQYGGGGKGGDAGIGGSGGTPVHDSKGNNGGNAGTIVINGGDIVARGGNGGKGGSGWAGGGGGAGAGIGGGGGGGGASTAGVGSNGKAGGSGGISNNITIKGGSVRAYWGTAGSGGSRDGGNGGGGGGGRSAGIGGGSGAGGGGGYAACGTGSAGSNGGDAPILGNGGNGGNGGKGGTCVFVGGTNGGAGGSYGTGSLPSHTGTVTNYSDHVKISY